MGLITIKDMCKIYNPGENEVRALDHVNLTIDRGEYVAIIGHSGSGKSTLAKMLNGLNKPTSGDVFADGINTKDEKTEIEVKRKVGMVFQNPDNQIIASIVEEDVAFGPENLGIPPKEIEKRVEDALKAVDMWEFRKSTPHHLSGGQKQRLCIARALAVKPEVLLMDEPTSALDPGSTMKVEELMSELKKNYTVVIVTHNMQQAARISDRTAFFLLGELVEVGPTAQIFSAPQDKRTEDYISGRFG